MIRNVTECYSDIYLLKMAKSGIFIEISQKSMINEGTLGFFTNVYLYLPKPVLVTRGVGFWGWGMGWPKKPQGYPCQSLTSTNQ